MSQDQITPPTRTSTGLPTTHLPSATSVSLRAGPLASAERPRSRRRATGSPSPQRTSTRKGLEGTVARGEELGLEEEIEPIPADPTVDEDVERMVSEAAELGDLKYLANVAEMQRIDPIEGFPIEAYDRMLRAPIYLSKLSIPHFRESDDGQGCVGNMASVHARYVTSDKVAYNVSKFGLHGLTQSIAAEGDREIRAFSISTGYVKTPLMTTQLEDTAERRGIGVQDVIEDVVLGQSRVKERMDPIDVGNLFVPGFSDLGRHLDGGDLLFDGGIPSPTSEAAHR